MTTVLSLLSILAINPNGTRGPDLSNGELGTYLQRHLATQEETERNRGHALRDELYRDGGCNYMNSVIDLVFSDERIRVLRKKWVRHARFNNALKRIVNELATVYAEPAKRTVGGDEANQSAYKAVLTAIAFDEQMLQLSRLVNLHRVMLVALRVRDTTTIGDDGVAIREPVLDVATPADVRVVLHPNDNKLPVGWCIRASHNPARLCPDVPSWTLWSDVERITLRDDFSVISVEQHGLGVCPWVPMTLGPIPAGFWPGEEGEDLVAARVMIWFQDILLAKESKSATKQPILKGDGVMTARGQAADSEIPNEIADGQSVSTVDLTMDLSIFTATADHVLSSAGYNYGLSPAILTHAGVQSAEARKLLRIPLGEIRRHQQSPLRRFEARFAVVGAMILSVDLPAMAFVADDFRIEFAEEQTPMSAIDELNLFLAGRQAGVDNTIAFLTRKKPGMSDDEARAEMIANIAVELWRNTAMRPLQAISGSMGAAAPGAPGANLDAPGAKVDKLGEQAGAGAPPAFVSPRPNSLPIPTVAPHMGLAPAPGA